MRPTNKNPSAEIETEPAANEEPFVDMFDEFRQFNDRLKEAEYPMKEWEKVDQDHFRQAAKRVRDNTMNGASLIASKISYSSVVFLIYIFIKEASLPRSSQSPASAGISVTML